MIDNIIISKIKEMTEIGYVPRYIGSKLKINAKEIREIIKAYNFTIIKEPLDISNMIKLYNEDVSIHLLEEKYSIDHRQINEIFKKNNVMIRSKEESIRYFNINENIFDNVADPSVAYWLGFLYADGNNDKFGKYVSLKLQAQDKEHVLKFIRFVGGEEHAIKYRKPHNNTGAWEYVISNKHISEQLTNLGCMAQKSFIIAYPEWIDKKLGWHFIRGAMEGDGSLSRETKTLDWDFYILGTESICNSWKNIFEEAGIKATIKCASKTGNNTYKVKVKGNLVIEKICDLLYKDADESIYLERKYQKYQELKKQNTIRRMLDFKRIFNRKDNKEKFNKIFTILMNMAPNDIFNLEKNNDQFELLLKDNQII